MRKLTDLLFGRSTAPFATQDSFILLLRWWRLVGVSPPRKFRGRYIGLSVLMNLTFVGLAPLFFNMAYAQNMYRLQTMEVLTIMQASLNVFGVPIKVVALACYMKRVRSVNPLFDKLDARYTRPEEQAKIRKCVMVCNQIFTLYWVSYCIYGASTILVGVFIHRPPLSLWLPFCDWRRSSLEYWIQALFDAWMLFYLLFHQIANDSYTSLYMFAIRTHVQLLTARVERLAVETEKEFDKNFEELVDCIVTHQELQKLADTIAPVISLTVFVQFLLAAAILSVAMINFLIFADMLTKFTAVTYYLCVVLQTGACCYNASQLEQESSLLPIAIFHCNWQSQPRRYRQMLIFFMQRAQVEITFMAMKLFCINLNMNLSIAKFSFTLYTFISTVARGKLEQLAN